VSGEGGPLTVALVALPETTSSTLHGMLDVFASVGRDWPFLASGVAGEPRMRPLVVGPSAEGFRAANGVYLLPDLGFAACGTPDLICVPDLFLPPGLDIRGRFPEAVAWLRRCHGEGATVAASCSGALLLAEAGLLDGCDVATHWAYCDALQAAYPALTVRKERVLVASGEGQRILTAGGGTSWQDLALFLVARFCGQEEAMQIARLYLLDWHSLGQLPFSSLAGGRQLADRQIAESQAWLAEHYEVPHAVTAMVERSGLSERSFKRRFRKATGMAPIDYVHALRLEEAKQMLETGDEPVEAIAAEVGYEDASFFRRLFRRKVGLAPAAYRRRFRVTRRALQQAEAGVAEGD
jgi:transcriptional regulator GlxA family with amidase domain